MCFYPTSTDMKLGLRHIPFLAVMLTGCALDGTVDPDASEDAVVVDTKSPLARAQYDANVDFANKYQASCRSAGTRPRVLVVGFGRFLENDNNATGRIVEKLVPAAIYPATAKPAAGKVDLPAPQTRVALGKLSLPMSGDVDVCAMIVPVYWDLAAILVAKEVDAFGPNLVMMNGIADTTQDLWIELGSVNKAMALTDGSDALVPVPPKGKDVAPIVPSASAQDQKKGLLLAWDAVREAAAASVEAQKGMTENGHALGDILFGAKLAGFPRSGNTYLCNNITYVTNYLMSYPDKSVTLLKASVPVAGKPNYVRAHIARDVRKVPRVFVHWPSSLADYPLLVGAASEVMRSMIDAQLTATASSTVGRNDQADVSLTGDTF
jgi:pyrrolidone-carboxylate peptidase